MPRYFAQIKYHGKAFHGWQRQPNASTVQQVIEEHLTQMLRAETSIVGCGRTDTGVHASQYYFHFDCEQVLPEGFAYKLNTFLPETIAVLNTESVGEDSHARFDATSRSYEYFLHRSPDPFLTETSLYHPKPLDFALMNEAASYMIPHEDFASFQRTGTDNKTTLCDVTKAEWVELGDDRYRFDISANRFLRNMVRAIVGTLLDVGRGKITPAEFDQIIAQKDRSAAGTSAPAHGLFLSEVRYPFL